jgi:hypothetical protein
VVADPNAGATVTDVPNVTVDPDPKVAEAGVPKVGALVVPEEPNIGAGVAVDDVPNIGALTVVEGIPNDEEVDEPNAGAALVADDAAKAGMEAVEAVRVDDGAPNGVAIELPNNDDD